MGHIVLRQGFNQLQVVGFKVWFFLHVEVKKDICLLDSSQDKFDHRYLISGAAAGAGWRRVRGPEHGHWANKRW